jgi:hypothetical protein
MEKENYQIEIEIEAINITIDVRKQSINNGNVSPMEFIKYLIMSSPSHDISQNSRWIELNNLPEEFQIPKLMEQFNECLKTAKPFTYEEAFKIKNDIFRAQVFGLISPREMIANLGHRRIKTDGATVTHRTYDKDGKYIGDKTYEIVYEVHEVDGAKLNVEEPMYAVKCWDTTTNEEHWLFIEEEYKDDPLAAIAASCRPPEGMLPYIKGIKRQGDVFLFELTQPYIPKKDELRVPLKKETYLNLLKAQS